MAPPRRLETQQGIELQFGTNHVGHHYLTRLLLPNMAKQGRVVTVASEAHRYSGSVDDWQPSSYSGWSAYGRSKLANILFSKRLQELLTQDSSEIQAVSLHPGVIATNLWQYIPRIVRPLTRLIASKSVEQGAATNVYCCLAKDIQGGLYYDDCQAAQPTSLAQDAALRADLWDYTEKLLQVEGFERPNTLLRKDRDPSNALILE
jgi:NAD(P)-dependent dehydrogenase (short-subunit alcohol dehydrogenase family)